MKKMTKEEYSKIAEKASPPSPILESCLMAFLADGVICTFDQFLVNQFQSSGLDLKEARGAESVVLTALTAISTALKAYNNLAKHARASTPVPITDFANSMVSPAMGFRPEGYVTGIGAKMFIITGSVLMYGICTLVIYRTIIYLFGWYWGGQDHSTANWTLYPADDQPAHDRGIRLCCRQEGNAGAIRQSF